MGTTGQQTTSGSAAAMRTLLTVAAVAIVALAGYGGFRFAAGLELESQTGAGLVALAVLTGFAVFFSPCSFPLLIAMLAGSDRATANGKRRRESLRTAAAIGTGAAMFLLAVGLVVGVAGEGLVKSIGFSTTAGRLLRGVVAATIITAGLAQMGRLRLPLWRIARFAQPIDRFRANLSHRYPDAAHVLYGFGLIVAGFG